MESLSRFWLPKPVLGGGGWIYSLANYIAVVEYISLANYIAVYEYISLANYIAVYEYISLANYIAVYEYISLANYIAVYEYISLTNYIAVWWNRVSELRFFVYSLFQTHCFFCDFFSGWLQYFLFFFFYCLSMHGYGFSRISFVCISRSFNMSNSPVSILFLNIYRTVIGPTEILSVR